jgi:sterol desaturase/sphingolipid hydroxylase (fatty acid hydroxylase superfamily)
MLSYLLTLILAFIFTEFVGYIIHILLHSQKIEFLSRAHMIHHLQIYGPQMSQRPGADYIYSTADRAGVAGIGLEWLAPAGVVILSILGGGYLFGIPLVHTMLFMAGSSFWGWFLFSYMHDSMHLKDFWMQDSRFLKRWYNNARKNHDIHHMRVNDEGKMDVNFGICFFFFDKIFGSYRNNFDKFNAKGLEVAREKYAFILKKP